MSTHEPSTALRGLLNLGAHAVAAGVRRHWPAVLPLLLVVAVFRAWFLPGLIAGEDFHIPLAVAQHVFPGWPARWVMEFGLGNSTVYESVLAPVIFLARLAQSLGASWEATERVLWLWPFAFVAPLGSYALLVRLVRSPIAAGIGATLYAVNPWTVGTIERGHIVSAVAYALGPLVLLALLRLIDRPSLLHAAGCAAIVTLQMMYDPRYTYLIALVVTIAALVRLADTTAWLRIYWRTLSFSAIALFAFNLYWIVPELATQAGIPAQYGLRDAIIGVSRFEDVAHAVSLFYPFYHHHAGDDGFGTTPVELGFFLLPLLVGSAFVSRRRQRHVWPAAVAAVAALLILSGPESPVGAVGRFFYAHVPGGGLFRDVMKFTEIVALAYAFGLALITSRLMALIGALARKRAALVAASLALLIITCYAGLMHDAFDPARYSLFAPYTLTGSDRALKHFLDDQPGEFRTIFFPRAPLGAFATAAHGAIGGGDLALAPAPYGMDSINPRHGDPLALYDAPYALPLLAAMHVRFVIVYDDGTGFPFSTFGYRAERTESIDFFRSRGWAREVARFGPDVVFRVNTPDAPSAYVASLPAVISGDVRGSYALAGTAFARTMPAFAAEPGPSNALLAIRLGAAYPVEPRRVVVEPAGAQSVGLIQAAFERTDSRTGTTPLQGLHVALTLHPRIVARVNGGKHGCRSELRARLRIRDDARGETVGVPQALDIPLAASSLPIEYDLHAETRVFLDSAMRSGRIAGARMWNAGTTAAPDAGLYALEAIEADGDGRCAPRRVAVSVKWRTRVERAPAPLPPITVNGSIAAASIVDRSGSTVVRLAAPMRTHQAIILESGSSRSYALVGAAAATLARAAPATAVRGLTPLSSVEVIGDLDTSGGVLAWAVTFDEGWRLYALPVDAPAPVGDPLADIYSLAPYEVLSSRHFAVNALFNAWLVPAIHGRIVLLYAPEAYSRAGLLAWLIASMLVMVSALRLERTAMP